jgi:hypothetical protein
MRRYERAMLLERLCQLRSLYQLRGDDDRRGILSIDGAVELGERLLGESADRPLPEHRAG